MPNVRIVSLRGRVAYEFLTMHQGDVCRVAGAIRDYLGLTDDQVQVNLLGNPST